jgi:hypothetical protein
MCFSGEMSGGFALLGLFLAWWVHSRTSNTKLAAGIFFFFTMEALQAVQYIFLASGLDSEICHTLINQVLTVLGFLHICLQPYFCHLINESLSHAPSDKNSAAHNAKLIRYQAQYTIVKRLCLIGGFLLFLRFPMSFVPGWNTPAQAVASTEWLRGPHVCTFRTKSMYHLGWSVPLADPSYNIMGAGVHSFLMFAPFFALYEKKGMVLQGLVLYISGPFVASIFTSNLMEQASIWCFFSIAQIAVMLFLIRETLIVNWGKAGSVSAVSGAAEKGKKQKS